MEKFLRDAKALIERLNVKVVSDAEAETCDYVVCARADQPTPFTDNVFDWCAHCGLAIQYRPHVPKKPPKIVLVVAIFGFETVGFRR